MSYREFTVRRNGWRWQPIYRDENGDTHTLHWTTSFFSLPKALAVAEIARCQWNDGMFAGQQGNKT